MKSPEEIAAYLAEREAEVEAQRIVVDRLDDLLDSERRHLDLRESQLTELRRRLAERGQLP